MRKLEEYINVGTKRMRCGYTTGSCAAAAARAATELLITSEVVPAVTLLTPAGIEVVIEVEEHDAGPGWAECAVQKDSGDDPDVTNGALVYARVEWSNEPGIRIDGGVGVGRVTREGLDQPVGEAAINSTPRRMIREQVEAALASSRSEDRLSGDGESAAFAMQEEDPDALSADSAPNKASDEASAELEQAGSLDEARSASSQAGLLVTISIPAGVELAAKTFNPRLGIEGGISMLGTGGIVRPMSEDALIASIELEMRMLYERGVRDLLVVPGNYGRDFACGQLNLNMDEAVSCSNYFGATLDAACVLGFERVLIVGHIGKMAKVAGGIMNTHSRVADCRVEVLAAHAALMGAPQPVVAQIMAAATTDAAIDVLKEAPQVSSLCYNGPEGATAAWMRWSGMDDFAGDYEMDPDGIFANDLSITSDGDFDDEYPIGLDQATMASLMRSLADKLNHRVAGRLQVEAIVFSNVHGVLGVTPGAESLARVWLA